MGFLSGCAGQRRAPGIKVIEKVAQDKRPLSVVWVMSPLRSAQSCLNVLEEAARQGSRLKLTVSLPVEILESLDEEGRERLTRLMTKGVLEPALQPGGSLPVPLLMDFRSGLASFFDAPKEEIRTSPRQFMRPVEVARLVINAEESWMRQFPEDPLPGLVFPAGAWTDGSLGAAAQSSPWILTASTGAFSSAERFKDKIWYKAAKFNPSSDAMNLGGILVIDEIYGVSPEQANTAVAGLAARQGDAPWQMVGLAYWSYFGKTPTGSDHDGMRGPGAASWARADSYKALWGSPAQARYWFIMAELLEAIVSYQNSGRASVAVLDELWAGFGRLLGYPMVSSLRQENASDSETTAREKDFLASVTGLHDKMFSVLRKRPQIDSSLWQQSQGDGSERDRLATAGASNVLLFLDRFDPAAAQQDQGKQDQPEVMDLNALEVGWPDDQFIFRMRFNNETARAYAFELYIELNRRAYAGRGESLDGSLRAAPADFWEYCVRGETDGRLVLYRHSPQGILKKEKEAVDVVSVSGDYLEARIPRSWISGRNPAQWGWALCVFDAAGSTVDCLNNDSSETASLAFFRQQ